MRIKTIFLLLWVCLGLAQNVHPQSPCKPPEIVFNKNAYNIFNEQQEMELGEVVAEAVGKNYRIITDAEANRIVREVGEKLTRHLPPTNIKFQFFVVDMPILNAFNGGGGRIYVTRKMIAFLRDEDELAALLGHELGHGVVRHFAIDMSKYFKEILGVTKVGDRKDIYQKYNELIDKTQTKKVKFKENHEDDQQLEADRIGLFAIIAAGYNPQASFDFFDRLTESKGKTGGFFSDILGKTTPEQKRLREMKEVITKLPPECTDKRASGTNEAYEKWQSYVVTTSTFQKEEKLKSVLAKRSLNPYLRGDIRHLRFSPDGNYILAQDDAGINVLKKEPFGFLFRIDTINARPAKFSPDSKFIVFQKGTLRVEKWSIEEKKPAFAREIFKRGRCWKTTVSPDGKYLVCYSWSANLEVIDTETSKVVWKKDDFFRPYINEIYNWFERMRDDDAGESNAMAMEFSPSGRYLLVSKVAKLMAGVSPDNKPVLFWETLNSSRETAVAIDLEQKKEVRLDTDLRTITNLPFAFLTDDKIVGQNYTSREKSGIFTFPGGERIETFALNADSYTPAHKGNYVLVRPTLQNPVAVYDMQARKFVMNNKTPALDIYGDLFVSENKTGEIGLFRANFETKQAQEVGLVVLPKSTFAATRAITLSPDFNWLVVSENSRGGVWNLNTGQRHIYIRGFRGAFFDTDGSVYADFPYYEKEKRTVAMVNPVNNTIGRLDAIETRNTQQLGKFLVRMKNDGDEKAEKKEREEREKKEAQENSGDKDKDKDKSKDKKPMDVSEGLFAGVDINTFVYRAGTMEVYDVRTRKLLWTKYFPEEVPYYVFHRKTETAALFWRVSSKTAKSIIRSKPELSQKLLALGDKFGDYLVQIVNSNTGDVIGETLIETGENSFAISSIFLEKDWLTIVDTENRILMYSFSTGELRWRFFGNYCVVNPEKALAAVENSPGQVSLYSLQTGEKIDELLFPNALSYMMFSDDGKKLFILTTNQNYYMFDAAGFGGK